MQIVLTAQAQANSLREAVIYGDLETIACKLLYFLFLSFIL